MKKFFIAAGLAVCLLALPMQGRAADNSQQIEFALSENKIDVSVTSSIAAREEISSLQLSLKVVSTDGASVRFSPDNSLSAKIVESRYHADTETLNIYVAGGEALFDKDAPTCRLGSVVLEAEGGTATVSAVEGSLKYVTGTELMAQTKDISYPAAVNLSFENGSAAPGENGGGSGSGSGGAGNTGENGSGENDGTGSAGGGQPGAGTTGGNGDAGMGTGQGSIGTGTGQGGAGTGTGQGGGRPGSGAAGGNAADPADEELGLDETGLREAMARAAGYDAKDYTEESYELLREAVKNAGELLDTHGVTQQELDEARLLIENAIGMLKLKDDSPVVQPEEPEEEAGEPEEAGEEAKDGFLEKLPLSWPVIAAAAAVILILISVVAVISWRRNRWLDN